MECYLPLKMAHISLSLFIDEKMTTQPTTITLLASVTLKPEWTKLCISVKLGRSLFHLTDASNALYDL